MRPAARELAAVFAGGVAGTMARAELAERLVADPSSWPWATFLVNVCGAFVLGWAATRWGAGARRSLVGTGFCGALTTFSTLQLELLLMLDTGAVRLAAVYLLASVATGLLAVSAASRLARGDREAVPG